MNDEIKQPQWTPKQVKLMGIFSVLVLMLTYMVICVGMLQSYPSTWDRFNYTEIQSCNQTTWNAISTSGFAFSEQWTHPATDIVSILYTNCAKYTMAARQVNNPLNVGVP